MSEARQWMFEAPSLGETSQKHGTTAVSIAHLEVPVLATGIRDPSLLHPCQAGTEPGRPVLTSSLQASLPSFPRPAQGWQGAGRGTLSLSCRLAETASLCPAQNGPEFGDLQRSLHFTAL